MTRLHFSPSYRARLAACVWVIVAALALAPSAHAQWRVQDDKAIKVLGNQNDGSINKNTKDTADRTKDIRDRLTLGTFDEKKPGERMTDPTVKLPGASATPKLDDGSSCNNLNDQQQPVCQQIVDIENSQYQYMLTVYETSNSRDTVLRELLKERGGLGEADYGKLEDNTNKLTALYNLIALDRQQMEAVNYAYNANIAYLKKKLALIAKSAQTGKNQQGGGLGTISLPVGGTIDLGSLAGGVVTGAVLGGALKEAQTDEPSGIKRLSIEKD